jgi:tRNA pseudouridine38-40 synthase
MRTIRLDLEYDGTDFSGWQTQKQGERTVQGVLETAVAELTGSRASVIGAGRTDAGVHALCQVAAFGTDTGHSPAVIRRALNAKLPPDVRVLRAVEAAPSFHPRYDALGKRYFYLMANTDALSPFLRRYAAGVPGTLDVEAMARAAGEFVGAHDFRGFMAAGSGAGGNAVRSVGSAEVGVSQSIPFLGTTLAGRFITFRVQGAGFLRHMVRTMAGTLIEVGRGKMPPSGVREVLASGERALAGPTAPARALFLERVFYSR